MRDFLVQLASMIVGVLIASAVVIGPLLLWSSRADAASGYVVATLKDGKLGESAVTGKPVWLCAYTTGLRDFTLEVPLDKGPCQPSIKVPT